MVRSTAARWHSFANEVFPMRETASHIAPEQGKFRRAFKAVSLFVQSLDHTSFDYTMDRIECLEREVARLAEELQKIRDSGPIDARSGSAAALED